MRSEVVFRATQRSEGRYCLCMLCAKAARAIHKRNSRIQDSINIAFGMIGQGDHNLQQESLFDFQLRHLHGGAQNLPIDRWTGRPV